MTSTFHGLETARRSLFAQQAALNTTGHNIANANTEGYSRQTVNLSASRPMEAFGLQRSTAAGQIGTGVEYDSITRIREKFLDDQYRNETKTLGSYEVQQDVLSKLEQIMNEPSDTGIRTVMSNFYDAWSDLSKNPESADGRKIVREQALALVDTFNQTAKQLNDLKNDLTENVSIRMDEANGILNTIGELNLSIQKIESLGNDANDLRDQRDLLTDKLSKIMNVNVENLSSGYRISMGSVELVSGTTVTPLTSETVATAYAGGDLNSGEMYGMIVSRDNYVEGYMKDLDNLVNTIANGDVQVTIPKGSVLPDGTTLNGVTYTGDSRTLTNDLSVTVKGINGLLQLGYSSANGDVGVPLFTNLDGTTEGITALSMHVNPDIESNANRLATSMRVTFGTDGETVVGGNNSMAVLMSQLRDGQFNFGTETDPDQNTADAFLRSVVGQLGVQSEEITRKLTNQQSLVNQVESNRQSVSGVSLDEEMSNLIKYQHAYNAAARNMTMIDEMLDKVINGMGRVGL
ncbi:flagellar hook-associated protein 1 FlgK [Paenibacillus phyllosphaerae]|uniref:Flagellar hook-associated protein 1 n=1 Tax=Paenibacillus phyllosphaerae TaxID=274593 RepID=A0A7W5AYJ2_9BACL|nr:flagellar hook-associated protein FlgK [Paenibacillus phyllosphaerae]MBB3110496.1 flagellar hook-associated protein 1 FlgK [Paenibacillus phyllosphaerae]